MSVLCSRNEMHTCIVCKCDNMITQSVTSCTSTCDTLFLSQCREGHLDVIQYLCADAGYDVKSEDEDGWTPLHFACW